MNNEKRCQVFNWDWRKRSGEWALIRCLWCEVAGWTCHVDRDLRRGHARSPKREAECLKRCEEKVGVSQS